MRILMRNTVFRTAVLASLFLCVMTFASTFSGLTASVHARTAAEVETVDDLKEFVRAAVDEYYLETHLKENCDLTELEFPPTITPELIAGFLSGSFGITDLSPASIQTLTPEQIRGLVGLFNSPTVQALLPDGLDIWGPCDDFPDYGEVFGREDGDWRSGSIYLFVTEYTGEGTQQEQEITFHGRGTEFEGDAKGLVDDGGRMIMELIRDAPGQSGEEKGIAHYCFDDPATGADNLPDDGDRLTAAGDSWKVSFVVDPFEDIGVPGPEGLPSIVFGSGIYPTEGSGRPEECDGDGVPSADGDGEEMMEEEMEEMEEMEEAEDVEDMIEDVVDSVSGGGCAIAAGSDSTPRGDALNLLLIVSALLFTVSFGNRAVGRRNGNSS